MKKNGWTVSLGYGYKVDESGRSTSLFVSYPRGNIKNIKRYADEKIKEVVPILHETVCIAMDNI